MAEQDQVQEIVATLLACLDKLDGIGARIAAAHVDTAVHALRRQFALAEEPSDIE